MTFILVTLSLSPIWLTETEKRKGTSEFPVSLESKNPQKQTDTIWADIENPVSTGPGASRVFLASWFFSTLSFRNSSTILKIFLFKHFFFWQIIQTVYLVSYYWVRLIWWSDFFPLECLGLFVHLFVVLLVSKLNMISVLLTYFKVGPSTEPFC